MSIFQLASSDEVSLEDDEGSTVDRNLKQDVLFEVWFKPSDRPLRNDEARINYCAVLGEGYGYLNLEDESGMLEYHLGGCWTKPDFTQGPGWYVAEQCHGSYGHGDDGFDFEPGPLRPATEAEIKAHI